MKITELEQKKVPHGEVVLIGLGRLGLRTALNLMHVNRGGPVRITVYDGQKISADDLIFRMWGGEIGEYKTDFLKRLAGPGYSREIISVPEYISEENLSLITGGDVACVEIAGGDTLPTTGAIIRHAQSLGMKTISTMGVFGISGDNVYAVPLEEANTDNPIVAAMLEYGISHHMLVGTGKLIRDWEPVTPYIMDKIAEVMSSEILRLTEGK
ncbi:UBA/THIF-type NAD/FAD binding protein [Methanocorpusculum labreanum Z]|uniref:UBA/THIF-type NAD/FAD binding protein n=1 Tax=Methanocorpusculum labreanum (strain ATCC 43576 / DSM 4855 / Z) TaxID=410358 RepID=A2SU97_METLZ|nr:ThiF family adenylyltransferase [Methanocorpusculum labreanum]ABN07903.1 UBA/THIF-type NAD/FAD binding protein [Methanocorpusculum labreanum Z]